MDSGDWSLLYRIKMHLNTDLIQEVNLKGIYYAYSILANLSRIHLCCSFGFS